MNPYHSPIGFRLRQDIVWHAQADNRAIYTVWIAEDPLTTRLFRCSDREHRMLQGLNEEATIESLQRDFHDRFAPETIEVDQIQALINKCNQSGILHPIDRTHKQPASQFAIWAVNQDHVSASERSREVIAAHMRQRESNWILKLIQWLSAWLGKLTQAQYPLGSPDRWISPIAPRLGWLYSGTAVSLWLFAFGIAISTIAMRFEAFLAEIPDLRSLRSPSLFVGYGVVFVLTRLFHEFGHAVACKRSGASCKDAGLIVSFGMVCPYVDITDSWRIGRRFVRMGIAMAGIYTECVLAFFAAVVWLSTHPGWMHDIAMQILLVCTVTTLLFNVNPLMKYDGYFVLCDWLNTQNLRERSFETLDAILDGRARRESFRFTSFLLLYFFASTINRVVLTCGLLTMVYWVASQLQLTGLGLALIILYGCCWTVTSMAAWTLASKFSDANRKLSRSTVWLGWTAVSLLVAWAVHLPLPNRVHTVGTFQLGDRQPVYSGLMGRIVGSIPDFSMEALVESDVIIALDNPIIDGQLLDLENDLTRRVLQLDMIERRTAFYDNRSIADLPMLRSQISIASSQLEQKQKEKSSLNVVSPTKGFFEPALASRVETPTNPVDLALGLVVSELASVSSRWTSESSKGRLLDQGTLIGWIVKDDGARIECRLPEDKITGINAASEVRVRLEQSPLEIFSGKVVDIAKTGQVDSIANGALSPSNEVRPMTYRIRIQLSDDRDWKKYSNGNAEVVFIRPSQSIVTMAADSWMRNSKLR